MAVEQKGPEMFWGITLDEGKRYTQVVEAAFHISMAALEPEGKSNEVTSVMLQHNNSEFLLCSLKQGSLYQQPLDLNFVMGESITLFTTGKGTVHLTGYTVEGEDMMDGDDDFDDTSDEEAPQLVVPQKNKPANKAALQKFKALQKADSSDDDDEDEYEEDDSDDDDLDMEHFLHDEADDDDEDDDDDDDDDEDDDDDDDEDDDDEDDDDDESEDDDDDDDESEDEEEEVTPKKKKLADKIQTPKMNGQQTAILKTPDTQKKQKQQTGKTPQQQAKTPQQQGKTPQQQAKTPQQQGKTPQQQAKTPQQQAKTPQQQAKTPQSQSNTPLKRKLPSGVTVEELKVGHGPEAKSQRMVHVYYTGKFQNGKSFDSCTTGKPFKFRLGKSEVIKGWDIGLQGMKVGGKRRLTIPPNMGYGNQSVPGIPKGSTLLFDIELKSIS